MPKKQNIEKKRVTTKRQRGKKKKKKREKKISFNLNRTERRWQHLFIRTIFFSLVNRERLLTHVFV